MSAQAPPRAPREAIPWYQRLEARVLVAVTLIAGCSLAAVTIVTGRVVESHSLDRAREDLAATRAAFTHLITTRTEFAHAQTKLIATLPVFRAYMTDMRLASDRETMEVMADAYRRDLSAAFCIVTAADGRWLASPGARMTAVARSAIEDLIRGVLNRGPARRLLALDGTVFLVVSEPVTFADEVLGTLTSVYRLDDEVAPISRRRRAAMSCSWPGTRSAAAAWVLRSGSRSTPSFALIRRCGRI